MLDTAQKSNSVIERDDIARSLSRSWDDLFGMDADQVAAFQLEGARERFGRLRPKIKALDAEAKFAGIDRIETLDDAAKLLFQHSAYKAYPVSFIEKNRFDMLTRWLSGYTSVDLSDIDVKGIDTIDGWLNALDQQSVLRVIHTSGTTGKLSFFPRTTLELNLWYEGMVKIHAPFDGSGVLLGDDNVRLPCITPVPRYGKYVGQRNNDMLAARLTPTPDDLHTYKTTLNPDLVSLSGRIRVAQAKGELAQMTIPESMRGAMRQYLASLERATEEGAEFFQDIARKLQGQRVLMCGTTNSIYHAALGGLKLGMRNMFAADSIGMHGGGAKGLVLPPDHMETIMEFSGIRTWHISYGMSEVIGFMPCCKHGHYHIPPYDIPFVLDPETGAAHPRKGKQTGRFACLDLISQTLWGGLITGDKVTLNFDGGCPCGRTGAYIEGPIERYSATVTGDDKITCAATVDNTDAALKQLLDIA